MEIIHAIIFVQSFVWATLLFRQPLKLNTFLGVSFLSLFLIYMLLYISTVFGTQIDVLSIPAGTLLLTLFISIYQLINLRLSVSKTAYIPLGLLLAASILLVCYTAWAAMDVKLLWLGVTMLGTTTFVYDTYIAMKQGKKKTFAGSILEDTRSKLSIMLLLDKFLVLLLAWLILLFPFKNETASSAIGNSLHFLVALLTFITGYMAVTASFHREVSRKMKSKKYKENKNKQGLPERVRNLMQEQKPYLDCELTLEKMADMLELSEHELTRLLNREMDTNFYTLINDYRMETVLQKLKESDNRRFTIMASAYESGFNSKSTFYRIFKEYTRKTPKEYLDNR